MVLVVSRHRTRRQSRISLPASCPRWWRRSASIPSPARTRGSGGCARNSSGSREPTCSPDLPNRRGFFQASEAILARAVAPPATIALLMADVDHFKTINDTNGHDAGDTMLRDRRRDDPRQRGADGGRRLDGRTARAARNSWPWSRALCHRPWPARRADLPERAQDRGQPSRRGAHRDGQHRGGVPGRGHGHRRSAQGGGRRGLSRQAKRTRPMVLCAAISDTMAAQERIAAGRVRPAATSPLMKKSRRSIPAAQVGLGRSRMRVESVGLR